MNWKSLLRIILHKSKVSANKAAKAAAAAASAMASSAAAHITITTPTHAAAEAAAAAAHNNKERRRSRSPSFIKREMERKAATTTSAAGANGDSAASTVGGGSGVHVKVEATPIPEIVPLLGANAGSGVDGHVIQATATTNAGTEDGKDSAGATAVTTTVTSADGVISPEDAAAAAAAAAAVGAEEASAVTATPASDRIGSRLPPRLTRAGTVDSSLLTSPVNRSRRVGFVPGNADASSKGAAGDRKTSIIISPAPSPHISVEPYTTGSGVWAEHQGGGAAIIAALNDEGTSVLPQGAAAADGSGTEAGVSAAPSQQAATPSSRPGYLRSPPSRVITSKPDLFRSMSMGTVLSPRGTQQQQLVLAPSAAELQRGSGAPPQSPFSPLVHRPTHMRGGASNTQSVSELLAAADMAAMNNTAAAGARVPVGRRAVSMADVDDSSAATELQDQHEPLSAGSARGLHQRPIHHTRRAPSYAQLDFPPSVPSLDWLTGGSNGGGLGTHAVESKERESHPHAPSLSGGGETRSEPNVLSPSRKPDARRVPSLPTVPSSGAAVGHVPSSHLLAPVGVHPQSHGHAHRDMMHSPSLLPRSPAALGARTASVSVSGSGSSSNPVTRGRGGSMQLGPSGGGSQPFSFLLHLPHAAAAGGSGAAALVSPLLSPAAPPAGLMSPLAGSAGKKGGGSGGSQAPSRRGSVALSAVANKQKHGSVDFLERALASLASEELLLLSNKANLHLYARMQQAQQQTAAAAAVTANGQHLPPPLHPLSAHLSPPVPGVEHSTPMRSATSGGVLSPTYPGSRPRAMS
jgi:hypothetical protein